MKILGKYVPWITLLLCVDGFAALMLWIADVQAFFSLLIVIILASALLFSATAGFLLFQEKHDLHVGDFESQVGRFQHAADRFRDRRVPRRERDFLGQVRFLDVVEERVSARFLDGADGLGKGNAGKTGCDPLLPSPALAECYPSPQDEQEGNEEKS